MLLNESCATFAPVVISFALLPVVLVWADVAEFVDVLLPLYDFWLQDESLSLHGFAIA
ncbi:hypothetical protein K788_0004770 [Paraburkholderia caribensis MBA4]|uniref:Uncharacterized protein n=1 Tax=Paraburkholderia caribensis MBA4 TaxID=1323664 RepID=A0A0P0RJW0_9BURK|nr:hypothetical protein K788_0004770 [Paraburkholderia caribensis MBA4]